MASKAQMTGMRGVYLVASELSRLGFIVSPTSRSARGADLLVTNQDLSKAFSVQVKTNSTTFAFWLLSKHCMTTSSPSHVYVFVNIRKPAKSDEVIEYFVVPSKFVAENMDEWPRTKSHFYSIRKDLIARYEDKWSRFGEAG